MGNSCDCNQGNNEDEKNLDFIAPFKQSSRKKPWEDSLLRRSDLQENFLVNFQNFKKADLKKQRTHEEIHLPNPSLAQPCRIMNKLSLLAQTSFKKLENLHLLSEVDDSPMKGPFHYLLNGDTYTGQFLNSGRHGFGKLTTFEGSYYIGDWQNDKKSGNGLLIYSNGDTYQGQFMDNSVFGEGKFTKNVDGVIQEGYFLKGKLEGQGKQLNPDGSFYEGVFSNGVIDGNGKFYFKDGRVVIGNFYKGNVHGKASIFKHERLVYEGEFQNNKKSGNGYYIMDDGLVYEGEFLNDQMHGEGKITW